ncbi:MFS transporter [Actinomadura sp. 7K507]|uniref:MFS transporter n=1 Tax=Actinomadura sp. 7K507 TaxID=2530365 RepID=UPI001404E575|nr:MFS transporter [Actinomadura sp. 7K507]
MRGGAVDAAATAAVVLFLRLPEPEGRPRIDYLGIGLLGAAVTCFTLFTSWAGTRYAWDSPVVLGLAAGAAALFAAWVIAERTAAEPVIPPRLFRDRSFAVACAVAAVGGATGFGLATYLPMFFQVVGGVGATDSGLLLLPMMFGLVAAAMGAGRYIQRTGRYHRLPAASMALSAAGVGLLATMDVHTGLFTAGCYMALLGFGAGLSQQVVVLIAQNAAPRRDLGAASSGVFATRVLGTAAGMAVFGAIVSSRFAEEIGRRVPDGEVPAFADAVRPRGARHPPRTRPGRCLGGVRDGLLRPFPHGPARSRCRPRRRAAPTEQPFDHP